MTEFIFELGDEVKDKITGFKGIVRSRTQFLTGCNVYGVQSMKVKTGENPESWYHMDEGQMELVKSRKIVLEKNEEKSKGGPHSHDQYPSRQR
jgi:hypothetical protein